ncbi:hypothetical protein Tco_0767651 [Tanacetum coccineum]
MGDSGIVYHDIYFGEKIPIEMENVGEDPIWASNGRPPSRREGSSSRKEKKNFLYFKSAISVMEHNNIGDLNTHGQKQDDRICSKKVNWEYCISLEFYLQQRQELMASQSRGSYLGRPCKRAQEVHKYQRLLNSYIETTGPVYVAPMSSMLGTYWATVISQYELLCVDGSTLKCINGFKYRGDATS